MVIGQVPGPYRPCTKWKTTSTSYQHTPSTSLQTATPLSGVRATEIAPGNAPGTPLIEANARDRMPPLLGRHHLGVVPVEWCLGVVPVDAKENGIKYSSFNIVDLCQLLCYNLNTVKHTYVHVCYVHTFYTLYTICMFIVHCIQYVCTLYIVYNMYVHCTLYTFAKIIVSQVYCITYIWIVHTLVCGYLTLLHDISLFSLLSSLSLYLLLSLHFSHTPLPRYCLQMLDLVKGSYNQ